MNLQNRIDLLVQLGQYLQQNDPEWEAVIQKAENKNPWFIRDFIQTALNNIIQHFLQRNALEAWSKHYHLNDSIVPNTVGIVMAGNIPLVGFHDFLCVFISGHRQKIKLSSKDEVLLPFLIQKLVSWNYETGELVEIADQLKDCDAYIATGSNNTALYFEQYFGKYPHIIRKNKTSVAVLTGNETPEQLALLAEDIHLYFGLGCRNVTKIYVPESYDFIPLLKAFDRYSFLKDHHRYMNNYDYQLSVLLINGIQYMTNGQTLLHENKGLFSPISVVHYEHYQNEEQLMIELNTQTDIQCMVSNAGNGFGLAQQPDLFTYADGVDTMQWLLSL